MSHPVAKLSVAAALLGVGGLFGAALTAGSDPAPAPVAAAPTPERSPVEVRTIVKRRTIHVYRRPKKHHAPAVAAAAPVAAPPPAPAVPAPAPAVAPTPVRASAPLTTRTSGSGSGREREDGDDRGEHESGEREGGDD